MKVTPKISTTDRHVRIGDIAYGDVFLYDNALWIVVDDCDQRIVNLSDGKYLEELCDTAVLPVTAEIKWSYKPDKKKTAKKKK